MRTRRIFIAADISRDVRRLVANYVSDLRLRFPDVRVRWEAPEKLHFTLKFLGATDEAMVSRVEDAISSVVPRYGSFTADLSDTGAFPNAREPRILWLGIGEGETAMVSLAKDIESALGQQGFAKEARAFSPHLTIGRIREPKRARALVGAHLGSAIPPAPFTVDHVTLYESILHPSGSSYNVISEHQLGGVR